MIPKRITRALVAGSMTAALLAMPLTAIAAVPAGWDVAVKSLPSTISPGGNAGYELSFINNGPSTISQLYLFTVNGPYSPVYAKPSQGSCDITSQLLCNLGQAKPSETPITIVVAFATSSTATGSFNVDFAFNTSGLGSGGGDNSHGDELPAHGSTTFSTDSTNFAGGFVVSSSAPVANSATSKTNGQQTRVYPPTSGIPVTVQDGPNVNSPACPAQFAPCVGETSEIHVGDGGEYDYFKVVIEIDKTAFADVNSPNLTVVHLYDDPTKAPKEITTACPKNGTPDFECATVSGGRNITITIWLKQNGFIKYH